MYNTDLQLEKNFKLFVHNKLKCLSAPLRVICTLATIDQDTWSQTKNVDGNTLHVLEMNEKYNAAFGKNLCGN